MEHPPCQCDFPTAACPRYGWMKGRRHEICRSFDCDERTRSLTLDTFLGVPRGPIPVYDGVQATLVPFPGVGTQLKKLLASLGIVGEQGCGCSDFARLMDASGTEWCKTTGREQILTHLRRAYATTDWGTLLKASWNAIMKSDFRPSILDPIGSLLDEAIRRAEEEHGS